MNSPQAHFFLSSCAQWCTTGITRTLSEAIKLMDKEKITYLIWYVPCAADAHYEVEFYSPQVKGAHIVELVEFKNGRRLTSKKETA